VGFGHYIPVPDPSSALGSRAGSLRTLRQYATTPLWSAGPLPTLLARLAALLGVIAAFYYAASGLTLAHYDAKAHLVVSRRILDSLTPGVEQIGAVWLPLPHLLNMLPVQIDHFYRTGSFAIAVSVLSNSLAVASIAATVMALTRSRAAATLSATLYATNPNLLYLQSTPMTEPLLFGVATLQVLLFTRWLLAGRLTLPKEVGWVIVLACLTRYEAWAITAGCLIASTFAWWRRGHAWSDVAQVHARLAVYPIATMLLFMVFSRITVGEWFVSSGFFVPDEALRDQPAVAMQKISEGLLELSGPIFMRIAQLAVLVVGLIALGSAGRSPMFVSLALFGSVALPMSAYLVGHPFRIRYEIPLLVACAVSIGLAVGLLRRAAPFVAIVILVLVLNDSRPFDRSAPAVLEAQSDQNAPGRAHVTACLSNRYRGGLVMASMGALAHYMHELSGAGFDIADFLHEGNGPMWDSAFTRGPAPFAEWVIVEERAEGGDAVIQRHRQVPRLLEDYERVCAGGDVALYQRRQNRTPNVAEK